MHSKKLVGNGENQVLWNGHNGMEAPIVQQKKRKGGKRKMGGFKEDKK